MEKRRQRERKKERKQELLFSRERARAVRSSGETLRIACCIFRAAQRRAVAFQSTRARRLRSGRFGNITVQIHGTYSCNHLEKERDACSVPTQPLAVTMPVETNDNDVAAGVFLLVLRRTFACPMRILPRKRSQAAFLAAFHISADVKGIDVFSAQRATTKVSFGTFQCDRGSRRRRRHCFFLPLCFLSGVPVSTSQRKPGRCRRGAKLPLPSRGA
jgi:hypothetical protein